MNGTDGNLESLWTRITGFLEPHLVFPATPHSGAYPIAAWPHEDLDGFFEFATRSEANVFYAHRVILDDDAAARLFEELLEDEMLDDQSHVEDIAATHRDEIAELELGFFLGPVYHVYNRSADWVAELSRRRDEVGARGHEDWQTRQREIEQARADAAPKQQEWSELLCKDKSFIGAKNPAGRQAAAAKAIPEMANVLDPSSRRDENVRVRVLHGVAWNAINEAGEAVRSTVRPELERQTISELDAVAHELSALPEWGAATTKTVQARIARDFLEDRIGFTNSALTEQIVEAARRANGRYSSVSATRR